MFGLDIESMIANYAAPHLGKITEGLESMAKEYGVEECFLMVRAQYVFDEKKQEHQKKAVIIFMHYNTESGSLEICKDKEGGKAEYPIEKLFELIQNKK